jgi:hypothetical protein
MANANVIKYNILVNTFLEIGILENFLDELNLLDIFDIFKLLDILNIVVYINKKII